MDDGSNDVRGYEDAENCLGRERRILPSDTVDHDADNSVDSGGEKDGRNNDEEVLNDEVYDRVRVNQGREDAEGVSDDFHGGAKSHGGEVPCAVPDEEEDVDEEGDGEENDP